MTEKPIGERMAHMEGVLEQVLPVLERLEDKIDTALSALAEKGSRQAVAEAHAEIDKLQVEMQNKADRTEVEKKADKADLEAVRADVKQLREKILIATGAVLVLATLVGWYGPKLLNLLAK